MNQFQQVYILCVSSDLSNKVQTLHVACHYFIMYLLHFNP